MIITNIGSTIILTQYRILQRTSNITSVTTSTNMSKNHMFFDAYVFVTMLSRTQWFNLFSEKTRVSILWWWSTAELTLGIAPSSCNLMYHVLFGNCCLTKKMLKPNLIYLKYNLTLFRTKYRKTNNDNIYIYQYMYILPRSFKCVSPLPKSHIWFVFLQDLGCRSAMVISFDTVIHIKSYI